MTSEFPAHFACNYQCLLNRLKLHGMQPKTIALYSHGVRRAGDYFDYRIDDLTRLQLTDYFVHIVDSLSWSSLKHDLYGLKFYYAQVLNKPWPGADLVKPPKSHTLPDIITVPQAQQIFMTTRVLSYRVFFFTLYSLGFRLGEGLRLQVGDIDADRMRVQVRNAKGNRDRFVPLPESTCSPVGWARLCAHPGSFNHTPASSPPSQQPSHAHIPHHAHSGEMSNEANQPHIDHARVR